MKHSPCSQPCSTFAQVDKKPIPHFIYIDTLFLKYRTAWEMKLGRLTSSTTILRYLLHHHVIVKHDKCDEIWFMKNLLCFAFLFVFTLSVSAQITSTFDTDADGWTTINATAGDPVYITTGGNPGGFLQAADGVGGVQTTMVAPAKFLGNRIFSYGQFLRFDLKVALASTTSNNDIEIYGGGTSIVRNLIPPLPNTTTWTTYSQRLHEDQIWKIGNTGGPVATKEQIKQVLNSVTAIHIGVEYSLTFAATDIGMIDNVILEQRILEAAPAITSFSPTSGQPGTTITITGSNFDPTPANNVVYFESVAATINSASATKLSVVVPIGANYGYLTIINKTTGLITRSLEPFNTTFDGGGRIIPASFKPKFDIPTIQIESVSAADVDGDGWIDLAVTNDFTDRVIDIYRNLGAGGTLSPASFAAKVSFAYTGLSSNSTGLFFADLDGDGKQDAITSTATAGFVGVYVTFRNTSTPGNISFEAPEYWQGASDESPIAFIGDLDGDGRPEMVSGEGAIPGGFWFNQNLSTPGNIEFGSWVAPFSLAVVNGFSGANAADLNGDGKPELIVSNGQGQVIDVLQNASTPGAPAFTAAFQFSTNQYTYNSMEIADMNLDGKNDLLYKVSGEVGFHIRLNTDTDGTLTAADFAADLIFTGDLSGGILYSAGISIADMNGDGKPDIVANDNTDFGVFENVFAGGVFDLNSLVPAYQYEAPGLNTAPTAPIAVDLNGDGKPEIFAGITNAGTPDKFTIYENVNISAPVISLNTVSPLSGPIGSTVTITGSNFSTVTTENIVWFGSVKATVVTATVNQLTVTVPPGAGYAPVSVTKAELTSAYHLPFQTTFSSGVTFDNTHFAPPVQFTLTSADYDIDMADLDNDGLPDVVAEGAPLTGSTSLFRNTHTSGPISATSLTLNGTTASAHSPRLKDLDGDGLIDMMGARGTVHKNNSTTGNISFQAGVAIANVDGFLAAFADFNQDGKTEIVVTGAALSVIMVENRTTNLTGNFTTGTFSSFAPGVVVPRPGNNGTLVTGDFDNDGYKDMIATNPFLDNISIYRNAQRPRANATSFATSVELTAGDNPQFIYTGDFDRDGKLDVLVHHGAGTSTTLLILFQNTSTVGSISFNRIDITNPSATTVATVADLDGDDKPEIITTSEAGNRFSIFKNLHTSGALTAASFAAPFNTTVAAPRGITTGDLNLNGKPEIIITRAAGLLVVYENLIPSIPPPTITSFTPTSGPVGITVTIIGTNFSTTAASNTVQFSGTTAVVATSTATSITSAVPTGATTGPVTVTVAGNTVTSATNFTVTPSPVITITTQPTDFAACVGQTATFTIVGTGTTNIAYQWQFSTTSTGTYNDIVNGGGYANAATASLSVNTTGSIGAGFYRCKVTGDFAATAFSNAAQLTVNTISAVATVTPGSSCTAGTLTLTASGGVNGQYRWYDVATGGTAFAGEVNSSYTSPSISTTTTYYVSINNGTCESSRTPVFATINSTTPSPTTTNSSLCGPGLVTLNASGGTNGQYRWYTASTGGTAISGEVNSSYTTPLLTTTTTYFVAINDGTCESTRTPVLATINSPLPAPTTTNSSLCGPGVVTLNASGGTNGQYRWYTLASGGTALTGEVNSSYVAPSISTTTTYYVAINNGTCESLRSPVVATVNPVPAKPIVTTSGSTTLCSDQSVTLSAPVGFTYSWSTGATSQQIIISTAGSFSVQITSSGCTSVSSDPIAVSIGVCNQPPVITATTVQAGVEGSVTVPINSLLSDPDNNLDLSTLRIIQQPSSGASASINSNNELILDYQGLSFAGIDELTIEVCDLNGECAQQKITIEVIGDIIVYNAISPNDDNKHPTFYLKFIEAIEETQKNKVSIFNRWGDLVWEGVNYNNSSVVFTGLNKNGNELPTGTYFYKIEFASGRKTDSGYLSLKR
jgi:gliding motility-associated-like protein